MKKKWLWVILILVVIVGCILLTRSFRVSKPWKDLTVADIKNVTVELAPPQIKLAVNADEIREMVEILNEVTVYEEDDSYKEYSGQFVTFTIIKQDGTQHTICPFNPFIIIDGVGYRTKYKPCEELNRLVNDLDAGKNGN